VILGEIGLVGEIRGISHPAQRLREAARQGFKRAVVPASCVDLAPPGLRAIPVRRVEEMLALVR
jgi:DNA repair protein RadA/Sms